MHTRNMVLLEDIASYQNMFGGVHVPEPMEHPKTRSQLRYLINTHDKAYYAQMLPMAGSRLLH